MYFWHDEDKRAEPTPKTAPPSELPTQRGSSASMRTNLRGRSPSGKFDRQPCRNFLRGICSKSPRDFWHPPECQFYEAESVSKFVDKCSFANRQLEGQPSKKPKQDGDKFERRTTVGLHISGHRACLFPEVNQQPILGSHRFSEEKCVMCEPKNHEGLCVQHGQGQHRMEQNFIHGCCGNTLLLD